MASIGAVAGGIFVLDEGGANLELVIPVQYPEPLADRYRLIPLAANVPVVDTVKTSAPMFLESLADYVARYPDFARAHPDIARNAFVSLPLALDGRCVGALVLGFGAARTFTPGERASLIALGARCADELERLHRLEADSAARRRAELASLRLERLHAFTGTLAQAITPAQVVDGVIDIGLAATSAQSTALWLSSPDGASLVLSRKVGSGGPGSEEIDRLPLDAPPRIAVVDAVRDGVAVWIESRRQLDERYPEMLGRPAGEASFACLPLVARGRRVGALVYGFEDTHRFLEDERAFLQVIAWYSAQAVERASIYQEARDADRLKDEFLAMLSHELRNPLAPMVTALDLMDLTGDAHFARRARHDLPPRAAPGEAPRRSARRGPHDARKDPARAGAVRAGVDRRRRRRDREPARRAAGAAARRLRARARSRGDRRSGAADAGDREPRDQRGEVHGARRRDHRDARPRTTAT